jgi:hypothetical protein
MASNPVWEICERMAEVQALLHDHAECGKHTAADVVAKAQAVLSEPELLRAMFDVGYFPPKRGRPSNEAARIGSEYVPRRYFGSVAGRPLHGRCPPSSQKTVFRRVPHPPTPKRA